MFGIGYQEILLLVLVGVPVAVIWQLVKTRRRMSAAATSKAATESGSESPLADRPIDSSQCGYFMRHWRGYDSLAHAYWVNGFVLSYGLAVAAAVLSSALSHGTHSLRLYAGVAVGLLLLFALFSVWSVVGIWRTARRIKRSGGRAFWAGAAQIAVVLGVINLIVLYGQNYGPQMLELGRIALGQDRMKTIVASVTDDGRTLALRGTFGTGSSVIVENMLTTSPSIQRVLLNSVGGRTFEADKIAAIVRARNMSTYVEGQCESGCTIIFLAGIERAATPNARIGFHAGLDFGSAGRS